MEICLAMKTILEQFNGKNQGVKKIFELIHKIDISNEFVDCADFQLTNYFEQETCLNISKGINMFFSSEPGKLVYEKAANSKLNAKIYFPYGIIDVFVFWKSNSKRIYDLSDRDVNCEDIVFWIDAFDKEECQHFIKPLWSLLTLKTFGKYAIDKIKKELNVKVSYEFLENLDIQLSSILEKVLGLKINSHISLDLSSSPLLELDRFEAIKNSSLFSTLYVNHNWNPITIKWKSKSGIDYKLHSTDIDKDDIEFWFEGLEPAVYLKQLYPNDKLPFKIKDLSFELVVTRLNLDCNILMELKKDVNKENLIKGIGDFIEDFNLKSEKKNRKDGVIHNSIAVIENENAIRYSLDLGSVGFSFFKKLLTYLSDLKVIEKLEIS